MRLSPRSAAPAAHRCGSRQFGTCCIKGRYSLSVCHCFAEAELFRRERPTRALPRVQDRPDRHKPQSLARRRASGGAGIFFGTIGEWAGSCRRRRRRHYSRLPDMVAAPRADNARRDWHLPPFGGGRGACPCSSQAGRTCSVRHPMMRGRGDAGTPFCGPQRRLQPVVSPWSPRWHP
jgi:hypothetical protein